ncbi:MAG: RNA methyltransferase [candidate division Zixibacteria bacterium]|nr:RNA methyltransferase [candidate division Zixibacteria bacterium]
MPLSQTELKNLRALLTRKGRRKQGVFLAEGVRLLEESLRHHFYPRAIYFAPSLLPNRGKSLVERFGRKQTKLVQIPARQLEVLTDTRTPQGLVGLFDLPAHGLNELYTPKMRNILVCDSISDPGNLGTLLRSAMAFDFDLTILCGSCVEPYSPKVVRSSMGAIFGLPIAKVEMDKLEQFVKQRSGTVVATGLEGRSWRSCYQQLRGAQIRLMAVGSEAEGLSDEMRSLASVILRIGHSRRVESLNAAVAGSIVMKQVYDSFVSG